MARVFGFFPRYLAWGLTKPARSPTGFERPIIQAHSADTTPENSTYMQICHGSPPPDLSRAVAMIGVMPDAKMPENWYTNEMPGSLKSEVQHLFK